MSETKTLNPQYQAWIKTRVPDYADAYGKCREVTEEMILVFPELKRVRGHYYCPFIGERPHWWCVTHEGQIVDPTVRQFPSHGIGEYVIWDESKPEPTGRCPNCSGYCFDNRYLCSEACERAYAAYCSNPH